MKKLISASVFLFAMSFLIQGQTVNFSEHIAPIIYQHCTSCHRAGEIGPFPLTNYTEVAANAATIKQVTQIGYMPPWKPDPKYQHYQKENYLTAAQIQLLADWFDQDMPQGNPALEPPLPVFPSGSQIGVPDLVLSFKQAYTVKGDNVDEYRYFVLPTGLTEDKDLIALEMRPGNTAVVHHTLFWEDVSGQARAADEATPEYGYAPEEADQTGLQSQLFGYVPGMRPTLLNQGLAQKLHAGADLKMQMHYAPVTSDETDSSTVNLFFAKEPATRYLQTHILLPLPATIGELFVIQANQKKEFHGTLTVPGPVSLFSISPHMHMLGTHWKVYAVKPDGDTIPLIHIPSWDFNWQGSYNFKKLIVLPAGTVIHAFAGYDNTIDNPNNPNSPPKNITWGEGTSDEMYYLPISYLNYLPGDENIVFEEENPTSIGGKALKGSTDRLYPVAPNPAGDRLKIGYTVMHPHRISLCLYDQVGKRVQMIHEQKFHLPGYHNQELHVGSLPEGIYFLVMEDEQGKRQTEKLVVMH
jgi:hypothetical protein